MGRTSGEGAKQERGMVVTTINLWSPGLLGLPMSRSTYP